MFEEVVYVYGDRRASGSCPRCGEKAPLVSVGLGIRMTGIDRNTLEGLIESNRVHALSGPAQMICLLSLARHCLNGAQSVSGQGE